MGFEMNPLQAGCTIERPDIDSDAGEAAWVAATKPETPRVTVEAPRLPSWWTGSRPAAWPVPAAAQMAAKGNVGPTPLAWGTPAVAEFGKMLKKLMISDDGPEKYPPIPSGVRTYSPFAK